MAENVVSRTIYNRIIEAWGDASPLLGFEIEMAQFISANSPGDQSDVAFKVMRRLLSGKLVEDGLCVRLLEKWRALELVLYASDRRYRDHFLHPFNTYLLGLIVGKSFGLLTPDRFEQWKYAAMFHDIGYPVEKATVISRNIRDSFFSGIPSFDISDIKVSRYQPTDSEGCLSQLAGTYVGSLSGGFASGRESAKAIFEKGLYNADHGIVSSVLFWNFALLDAATTRRQLTLELVNEACLAMALHNIHWTFSGLRIRQTEHPIAFLLALCDELQEWGRISQDDILSGNFRNYRSSQNTWNHLKLIDIVASDRTLKIAYHVKRGYADSSKRLINNLERLFQSVFIPEPEPKGNIHMTIMVGNRGFDVRSYGESFSWHRLPEK